jgi:hypothetical protein
LNPATAQTKTPDTKTGEYSMVDGHLRMKPYQGLFFNLGMHEVRRDTIFLHNNWNSSMQLEFKKLPKFLEITAHPALLPPMGYGYLLVTYHAALRDDYDMVVDQVELLTNDTLNPVKKLEFIAVITEDFSTLSLRDKHNSPVGILNASEYNFGVVKQGSIARYNLQVTNTGKDTLFIRKISSSCGCTTGKPDKTALLPLETATVLISFNTFGRIGYQEKSVTIITNDPENPYLLFTISGTIEK